MEMDGQKISCWLLVEPTPSGKILKSVGMMTFPIHGKMINIPNHQFAKFLWEIQPLWNSTGKFYGILWEIQPLRVAEIRWNSWEI